MRSTLVVKCDASCRGLVGGKTPIGVGVYVYREFADGSIVDLEKEFFYLEELGTTYFGEVYAMTFGAEMVVKHFADSDFEVKLCGDNQTVVRQVNKKYAVNKPEAIEYIETIQDIVNNRLPVTVDVCWIKRDENKVADKLSKMGRQRYLDEIGFDYDQ